MINRDELKLLIENDPYPGDNFTELSILNRLSIKFNVSFENTSSQLKKIIKIFLNEYYD